MVNLTKLSYNNIEEYNQDFLDSLLKTNHTHDFFVDWNKVFKKLEKNLVEINILNSLSKIEPSNSENKFKEILTKYPECIPILPTILAIRDKNVDVFDTETNMFKNINFDKKNFNLNEIIEFSKKTGLIDFFTRIDDLYSYLTGTEVGLDTNARKNRSGKIFEKIVGDLLTNIIIDYPQYSLVAEDSSIKIKRSKRADFVIYENKNPKFIFECNFYNSTGSKPIETANAYIDLQRKISDTDMTFIWITDGMGWKKMFSTLKFASKNIEYVLNYNMLKNKIKHII